MTEPLKAIDVPCAEVTGLRDLRFVAGIDPAVFKDPLPFQLQNVWVGEHPAVDAKQPLRSVVDHQVIEVDVAHPVCPPSASAFTAENVARAFSVPPAVNRYRPAARRAGRGSLGIHGHVP